MLPASTAIFDIPISVDCSANGDIVIGSAYVTTSGLSDMKITKLNSSGTLLWDEIYDYSGFHDAPTAVGFSGSNIKVVGMSGSSALNWDYTALAFNSSGTLIDEQRVLVPGLGLDNVTSAARDDDGNMYITGYREENGVKKIQTVKLGDDLEIEWVKTFSNGIEDVALAVTFDENGNVFVTGYTAKTNGKEDAILIKYSVDGDELWTRYLKSAEGLENARGKSLVAGLDGSITLLGELDEGNESDLVLARFSTDGDSEFYSKIENPAGDDAALDLGLNAQGDILITSTETVGGTTNQIVYQFEIIERNNQVLYEYGEPRYLAHQLLVRFNPNDVFPVPTDDQSKKAGTLDEFVSSDVISSMNTALGTDAAKIRVFKVHTRMTSAVTTSVTRLGDIIKVPAFWATLLLDFEKANITSENARVILNDNVDGVLSAERNWIFFPAMPPPPPDDTFYSNQQHLYSPNFGIDAEGAWDIPLSEVGGRQTTRLGLVDTGIFWAHDDFHMNETTGLTDNEIYDSSILAGGYDFLTEGPLFNQSDEFAFPNTPHGTHSAGILCAVRNNDKGVAGVAGGDWQVNTSPSPLYVFAAVGNTSVPVSMFYEDYAQALVEASIYNPDNDFGYGINVLSMSYGLKDYGSANNTQYTTAYPVFATAFEHMYDNGVIGVVARHNYGLDSANDPDDFTLLNPQVIPATIGQAYDQDDWLITIGGVGSSGNWHSGYDPFSDETWAASYDWLDVSANCLGGNDYTTTRGPNGETNMYSGFGGTSSATPTVAGIAALMYDHHNVENMNANYPNDLAPDDIEYVLEFTATTPPGGEDILHVGAGIANAAAAVWHVDKPTAGYEIIHSPEPFSTSIVSDGIHDIWFKENNTFGIPGPAQYEVERFLVTNTYSIFIADGEVVNDDLSAALDGVWERDAGSASATLLIENDETEPYFYIPTDFEVDYSVGSNGVVTITGTGYAYQLVDILENEQLNQVQEEDAEDLIDNEVMFPSATGEFRMNFSLYCRYCDFAVGTTESEVENKVILYPNPAAESIYISDSQGKISSLRLYDNLGKIQSVEFNLTTYGHKTDVSALSQGIYVVEIEFEDGSSTSKSVSIIH